MPGGEEVWVSGSEGLVERVVEKEVGQVLDRGGAVRAAGRSLPQITAVTAVL
jgi:hypothetical protein